MRLPLTWVIGFLIFLQLSACKLINLDGFIFYKFLVFQTIPYHNVITISHGYLNYVQVLERAVSVEEMLGADEMFCTGTAMVVNSVASVTYKKTRQCRMDYKTGPEALSAKLRTKLVGIQTGCVEGKKSWTVLVD